MSTHYYKCCKCKNDIDELQIWEEFDGNYCVNCYFDIIQTEESRIQNDFRKDNFRNSD